MSVYLQLVGNIPVHKASASASWLKILTDVHYRDDEWFVVMACKAKKLKNCLEKSWAWGFILHGNPSKYPKRWKWNLETQNSNSSPPSRTTRSPPDCTPWLQSTRTTEKKLWLSLIFHNGLLELRDKFYKSRPFISKSQGALKIN